MLRPIQVQMLVEAFENGGLLAIVGVGHGKTLPSILVSTVIKCDRPLLIVPAKLRRQTIGIIEEMRKHFKIHNNLKVISYAAISTQPGILENLQPDLISADEVHKLKDITSGRTKRVIRYLDNNPSTVFCGFSGTIYGKSLFEFAHLVTAALREKAPVPYSSWSDLNTWDMALKGKTSLGALEEMPFRERLIETPGIVATSATSCDASIEIELRKPFHDQKIKKALQDLRYLWVLPDGTELCEIFEFLQAYSQLYCGFYYRYKEAPPTTWMDKRRIFNRWLRNRLRYNRRNYDTPKQIFQALERGEYVSSEYRDWCKIRDTYEPVRETIWISTSHLEGCEQLARENNSILWTQYRAFGVKSSLAFYDSDDIYNVKNREPICASIKACGEGKNLQKWDHNIVAFPPTNGVVWEQLIGRTHREGQVSDQVEIITFGNIDDALENAKRIQDDVIGLEQKLLKARIIDQQQPGV